MGRKYFGVEPLSTAEALRRLDSVVVDEIVGGLLALAYSDAEGALIQEQCRRLARHASVNVRGIAIECLGHLRTFGKTFDRTDALRLVEAALADEDARVRGKADDARRSLMR
jgi:hypothetical protein